MRRKAEPNPELGLCRMATPVCISCKRKHHDESSPEEIHQIGLEQVKEIEARMITVRERSLATKT